MDIDFVVAWVNMDDQQWYVCIRNNARVINQFSARRTIHGAWCVIY